MDVQIITFPETKVAAIEHRGSPASEHETVMTLVSWKLENRLVDPQKHRSYGLHYTDPFDTPPEQHRVTFCLSIEEDVASNRFGVKTMTIPSLRCARARDIGSRYDNRAAAYLYKTWLPASGERVANFPAIFHYVNVGPHIKNEEMITDVYMPLV